MLDDILATIRNQTYKQRRNQINNKTLQQHYQSLFQSTTTANLESLNVNQFNEPLLTKPELDIVIKNLKNNKTPGNNGITNEMIKQGGEKLQYTLLNIMNKFWTNPNEIPNHWLNANVISIYKNKGLKSDPNNYRSIFLLDTLSKIFSGMICNRLVQQTDNQIPPTQFGFRKHLTTGHAITTIRHIIQCALDSKKTLIIIFVDLTKAFDTLPKSLIQNALAKTCHSRNINLCINKLLDNPKGFLAKTKLNFTMYRGVKQGSKEGPTLFNLVFKQILEHTIDHTLKGVELLNENNEPWTIKHLEYADDLCILANDTDEAIKSLNSLQKYLRMLNMEISTSKTKYMIINKHDNLTPITIENKQIEEVTNFLYLGSILNHKGSADDTITHNIAKSKNALIKISPILKSKKLNLSTKTKLINTLIIPHLTYSLESIVLRKKDWSRLEAVLNTTRRIILNIKDRKELNIEQLHEKIHLPNIATKIMQNRLNLWYTAKKRSDNIMIKTLTSHIENPSKHRNAHTKNWIRQLTQDINEMKDNLPTNWKKHPTKVKIAPTNTHQPKVIGQRQLTHPCKNINCYRMFATKKEMNRHFRNDHNTINPNLITTTKLHCPITDCNKTYKTIGWLNRHIISCHPQYSQHETKNNNNTQTKTKTQTCETNNTQQCPYPGCNKILPTAKGIINHCYVVHRWSAITGTEVKPKKKQTAKTAIEPR